MFIRQDWLDNLGLKMPTTIEELKEVARGLLRRMIRTETDRTIHTVWLWTAWNPDKSIRNAGRFLRMLRSLSRL